MKNLSIIYSSAFAGLFLLATLGAQSESTSKPGIFEFQKGATLAAVLSLSEGALLSADKKAKLTPAEAAELLALECQGKTDRRVFSAIPTTVAWIVRSNVSPIAVERMSAGQVLVGDFLFQKKQKPNQ